MRLALDRHCGYRRHGKEGAVNTASTRFAGRPLSKDGGRGRLELGRLVAAPKGFPSGIGKVVFEPAPPRLFRVGVLLRMSVHGELVGYRPPSFPSLFFPFFASLSTRAHDPASRQSLLTLAFPFFSALSSFLTRFLIFLFPCMLFARGARSASRSIEYREQCGRLMQQGPVPTALASIGPLMAHRRGGKRERGGDDVFTSDYTHIHGGSRHARSFHWVATDFWTA